MNEKLLTPVEVSKILKRSVQWVYDAIECGELKGTNLSLGDKRARWVINSNDLQVFLVNREGKEQQGG